MDTPTTHGQTDEGTPPSLSLLSFSLGLGLLLGVFLLLNPIWDAPDMGLWNENIWWSYAPIPLVAAALLAFERKLSWATVVLETLKLTFVKFAITFLIAQVVWEIGGVPGTGLDPTAPAATEVDADRYLLRPQPPATRLEAARTGAIDGRVVDASGAAVEGALVWIDAGLDELVFTAPGEPVVLTNSGAGFASGVTVVRTFQPLLLRNADEQLHTAVIASARGKRLLNYPVLPGGERELMFDRAVGLVRLSCTGHGAAEPAADLLVLGSPFVARTNSAGRFAFEGVPAGELRVAAKLDPVVRAAATVTAGARVEVELRRP